MSDPVRTVHCSKLKADLPGLPKPPFSGELGKAIYDNVSDQAWRMWKDDMMIKIINEYRIKLAESGDYEKLIEQMKGFLSLDSATVLEVENAQRGRGESQ